MIEQASAFGREIIGIVILSLVLLPPMWRIYDRAGLDTKRALLVCIPGGWMANLMDLAATDWPAVDEAKRRALEKSRES